MHTVSAPTRGRPLGRALSFRHTLADGQAVTVHTAVYQRSRVALRVVALDPAEPLAAWCRRASVADALVGGFFVTPVGTPLGELWIDGARRATTPFDAPWHAVRSCVAIDGDRIELAGRADLPAAPRADLLQAGPLLVQEGSPATAAGDDREGFSAGNAQFDSDITQGRHPRAALGIDDNVLIVVACDGRADHEAGLTLPELARLMVALGARDAINLDGGGSATLIADGRLRNHPRPRLAARPSGRPAPGHRAGAGAAGGRSAACGRRVDPLHPAREARPGVTLDHPLAPGRPAPCALGGIARRLHEGVGQRVLVVGPHEPAGPRG